MFTGIITDIGTIRAAEQRGDLRLIIGCGYDMGTVDLGASIACSGACLTVVDKGEDWFAVDISAESVARTAAGMWAAGQRLNLERALRLGDELGGHLVTGHVDGVGTVLGLDPKGDSVRIAIEAPAGIGRCRAKRFDLRRWRFAYRQRRQRRRRQDAIRDQPHPAQRRAHHAGIGSNGRGRKSGD